MARCALEPYARALLCSSTLLSSHRSASDENWPPLNQNALPANKQFIKAMRNPDGTVQHNAHLMGFFRRLCKLLYMKIRPVIVFDGAPPMLKKNTLKNRNKKKLTGQVRSSPQKSRETNRWATLIALTRLCHLA